MSFIINQKKSYFLLVLACLLVYANSLSGDFVFDDTAQIVNNPALHSWRNIIDAFTSDVWAFQKESGSKDAVSPPYYRPLFTVYLTVGYMLFGLWQQGWHLLNLGVHIIATLLAYRLFHQLSSSNERLSLVGALLFALTPIHVESVSWISGVPDVLAALFYIPAIIFYIRYREFNQRKFIILSLISFFLALLCKETPIVLPLVLFVWEIAVNRKKESAYKFLTALKPILIFALPTVIYLVMRFLALGSISRKHPSASQTAPEFMFASVPYVIVSYIENIIFPFNLSLIYDSRLVNNAGDIILWLPLAILFALGALIYLFRQKMTPLMWTALGLFFIPLLPVLNLQVFHYKYIIQDRYLYLPSIGFVLFLACLLEKLWTSERKHLNQLATVAALLLCLAYTAGTIWQNRVWHSEIDLWTRAAATNPNWWANYYNLGLAYYKNNDYEEAVKQLDNALKHEPFDNKESLIYNNRGLAKKGLGKTDEAEKDFRKSLELDPKSIEANINLGALLFDKGNYIAAEAQFKKTMELDSSNPSASYNLARTWAKLGRHREAVGVYEKLLQIEKRDAELMFYAAVSYSADGQKERAANLLSQAARQTRDEKLKRQIIEEEQKLK